ncbi:MAG: tRNA (adenosine(37)-N6)-threonylcarbamoyltransferase complex dimerization subunit type 1 TsaB [Gemmataceae bacterium]|nr:tRNA (adenosine(37)-N6)-threonylcarbamoyltransferase complex dimerization subunit type 1 TsaB [Planctomycetia bacterium]MBX3401477.1 tRNA (adenosine(37)-N6)-threonylcarbamoyltransferase complex dimerization subunit type 1 TsaB [Gemmataceae bacterium]
MSDWRLVLETSGRVGKVGLANGSAMAHRAELDPSRRHARDLAATIRAMLERERLRVADLGSVLVSVGPGGYTGLRVGLATAKTLAYATNVPLVAVPTFHAIASQAPVEASNLWVIADALQGTIYLQRFTDGKPIDEVKIVPAADWLPWANGATWLTGPGVAIHSDKLNCSARIVDERFREPTVDGVLAAGATIAPLSREELFAIEPLYLRGSSAEEKARNS